MATPWSLTFDCADARAMARFWTVALGYVDQSPPAGWDTWEAWLRHFDVPEDEWADGASLCDPDGVLPAISFLRVPEPKTAKNRIHLDLHVSGGRRLSADVRGPRIAAMVDALVAAGGSVLASYDHDGAIDHVTMTDPEGNVLCVV